MPCEPDTPSAAAVALDQHIGNEVGGLLRLEGGGGVVVQEEGVWGVKEKVRV